MAKILIAEDEAHILRLMSMWLKKNGHEVIETRNGAEALTAIEAGVPDLIVSDMNMPLVTGEERIVPERPRYWVCTVESMPLDRRVEFLAVD